MTDCFKPSPRRPYEIPWEQKAVWAFFFGSMLLIAIIGNCIVIWIVLGELDLKKKEENMDTSDMNFCFLAKCIKCKL